jgi:hypothetical protein
LNGLGYIVAGYVVTFGAIGAYVARLLVRGRALGRQLPPEERRWT